MPRQRYSSLNFIFRHREQDSASHDDLPEEPFEGVLWGKRRGSTTENELCTVEESLGFAKSPSPFQLRILARNSSWHDVTAITSRPSSPSDRDTFSDLAWTGISVTTDSTNFILGDDKDVSPKSTSNFGHDSNCSTNISHRGSGTEKKKKFTIGEPTSLPPFFGATGRNPGMTGRTKSSPEQPRFISREAMGGTRRRWTLAMAMTDDDITDEALVEELERLRSRNSANDVQENGPRWEEDSWTDDDHQQRDGTSEGRDDSLLRTAGHAIPYTPSLPSFPSPHLFLSSTSWHSARRALLTCREIVRTERRYLSSLKSLLDGETDRPPPALMLKYVAELVEVSERLLGRMEEDPSAWGVAAAFLGVEEEVEGAFVRWCGVVGAWFINGTTNCEDTTADDVDSDITPPKTPSGTWRRRSMPSMSSMRSISNLHGSISMPFLIRRKEKERHGIMPSQAKRMHSVRDLAIVPTQRVTRYVLLYRDLLTHTPLTSPSGALVERALGASQRIAKKCDRAQGNSAFLQTH